MYVPKQRSYRRLNDFEVSISSFWMVLESKDLSQKAEKVSGPRDMMKREMMEEKILLTHDMKQSFRADIEIFNYSQLVHSGWGVYNRLLRKLEGFAAVSCTI